MANVSDRCRANTNNSVTGRSTLSEPQFGQWFYDFSFLISNQFTKAFVYAYCTLDFFHSLIDMHASAHAEVCARKRECAGMSVHMRRSVPWCAQECAGVHVHKCGNVHKN